MKRSLLPVIGFLFVLLLAACGGGADQSTGEAEAPRPATPPEYAGRTNPLAGDPSAIETGKQIFATNCSPCHGPEGRGDGPASQSLNTHPKDLAAEMDELQDDYIYWRISEGGMMAPFHSAMPAWKTVLAEEQIWQMIAFMRTLEP
jgi:mono/diheme cytochrome c family protein